MHGADLQIALPPQQGSGSFTKSSPSTVSSSASYSAIPIPSPLRNSCTTHSDDDADRPGTPYPTNCQLCLSAPSAETGPLGALVEEEEEDTGATISGGETVAAREEREPQSGVAENVMIDQDSSPSGTDSELDRPSQKRRASSWIKRLVAAAEQTHSSSSNTSCNSSGTNTPTLVTPARSPSPPSPTPEFQPQVIRQPLRMPTLPPTIVSADTTNPNPSTARSPLTDRRSNFHPLTLMPVVGYAYTAENSCWKAPPTVGPQARRKKAKSSDGRAGSPPNSDKAAVESRLSEAERTAWAEIKVALHLGGR